MPKVLPLQQTDLSAILKRKELCYILLVDLMYSLAKT